MNNFSPSSDKVCADRSPPYRAIHKHEHIFTLVLPGQFGSLVSTGVFPHRKTNHLEHLFIGQVLPLKKIFSEFLNISHVLELNGVEQIVKLLGVLSHLTKSPKHANIHPRCTFCIQKPSTQRKREKQETKAKFFNEASAMKA